MLGLGSFPENSLAGARAKRDAARKLLANGIDPSRQKKLDKITTKSAANNTFAAIAEEHLKNQEESGTAASTMVKNRWYLQDLAAPLANLPITEITPAEILGLLKKIEKSGRRETARKVRGAIGSVFRLAITTLRATNDPTFPLRGALLKPNVQHRPAGLEPFAERGLDLKFLSCDFLSARPLQQSFLYDDGSTSADEIFLPHATSASHPIATIRLQRTKRREGP